ncbi:MAG: hypothetical protein ACK5XN_35080, partial [Bacteroidota bacterium]
IIIRNIFRGVVSPCLESTFNEVYRGNINKIAHLNMIDTIVDRAIAEKKDMILSMVSIASRPVIDINVRVVYKLDKTLEYYIVGRDLRKYHMFLPKIHDRKIGRSYGPRTGTNNSKWYPFFMATVMKNIALHLRMLDLYLKTNRVYITQDYTVATSGILGIEVPVEIPESFADIINVDDLHCDSNPIKKSDGIYIFGKNGTSAETANKMLEQLSTFKQFKNIYPVQIKTADMLVEFVKSPYIMALAVWNHHARVLVKNECIKTIEILDPWKKTIDLATLTEFTNSLIESKWKIKFIQRSIVDQFLTEGSCVMVAFSRLLFMASFDLSEILSKYNVHISDFFAFLTSFIYRKTF